MHELYASHDVFLSPSPMGSLPNVLLEAMASGMLVITSETCGMTDVVEDDYNGLLVRPADAPAIEQAVLRLANLPDLAERLGRAARHCMSRYTWERSAQLLESLFRRILASEG